MAATPATSRLKVAVIGAGPIGLCTAAALRQQGHIVTVFERRQDPEPRGHALVIQPAATRALEYLKGAHSAFERVSVQAGPLRLWSYTGDKPFAVAAAAQQPCRSDKRFQTDRPSVQNVFHGLAVSSGVQLLFGRAVVKVEELADSASLSTADGMTHNADLVIAADGMFDSKPQTLNTKLVSIVAHVEFCFRYQIRDTQNALPRPGCRSHSSQGIHLSYKESCC